MVTVDARGLACPEPVMLTMSALKKTGESVKVIVDNAIARDNVVKQGKKKGRTVTVNEVGSDFEIVLE